MDIESICNTEALKASSLKTNKKLIAVVGIAAAACIALFITILSLAGITFSFTDIPYYFLDGQEITLNGRFVECVPNRVLAICQSGFQSDDGKYFFVTNMQEMIEENAEVLQPTDQRRIDQERRFQLDGLFTYGLEEESGFEAVGRIEVTFIAPLQR